MERMLQDRDDTQVEPSCTRNPARGVGSLIKRSLPRVISDEEEFSFYEKIFRLSAALRGGARSLRQPSRRQCGAHITSSQWLDRKSVV